MTKIKPPPIFKLFNKNLKEAKLLTYLGITIDRSLSFLPHIENKRLEINKLVQNLYKFSSLEGRLPPPFFKIWYLSILQRKLAYASPCWFPRMWGSHGRRILQSAQRSALLLMTRAYGKTATETLQILTGIPPINLQLQLEAEFSGITRLGISTEQYCSYTYQNKVSKFSLHPSTEPITLSTEQNFNGELKIFTDGSKINNGVGSAYCVIQNNNIISNWKSCLSPENSVYQAELFAILNALHWALNSNHKNFLILTDSLSGIQALQNFPTSDAMVSSILHLLQSFPPQKTVSFTWVRGHTGIMGNEAADKLAKQAAQNFNINTFNFVPFPTSFLKYQLKQNLLLQWQTTWTSSEKGRYTFKFFPKASTSLQIVNRELVIFLSNHGPFQSYLHRIGKRSSPLCICGQLSTSLHYILECPLTSTFHIRKDPNLTLSAWFSYILKNDNLKQKIIKCIKFIESNEHIFINPGPVILNSDSEDESLEDVLT